jgi:2',3'-cyclic-nucleotide 2'-phosphodiesterase (5'-nucleotidase family)
MKTRFKLSSTLAAVLSMACMLQSGAPLQAAAFTPGNVVIYRVGSGTGSLINTGNPVFLDEYSSTGTLVQSIPLPTTVSGANKRLVASGTATSEGMLTRSADGQYLLLTGYDATPPVVSLAGTASVAVNRVIGRVNAAGTVDTSTALTDFASANNPRSAVSSDGSKFWMSGGNGGVRLATLGATSSTDVSTTVTNLRQLGIAGGQLYVTTSSGTTLRLGTVGAGLPETTGQTITSISGFPTSGGSPYSFFFADLNAGIAGVDTLYVADDSSLALTKYSLVASTWTSNGTVGVDADDYRGLTGVVNAGVVTLYATRKGGSAAAGGGELVTISDSSGHNVAFTGTPTLLATAAANTAFRGVAFAPVITTTTTLAVTASPASFSESATNPASTGTVTRSPVGAADLVVTLTSSDPTEATVPATVTILANQASANFDVSAVNDADADGNQAVVLTASAAGVNSGTFNVTVQDDEPPPALITIADASITEGNSGSSTLNLVVSRTITTGAFTVDFATSSGTATSGTDFTATSGTLTFTAGGAATQNVSVSILGDTSIETNETFTVTLSNLVVTSGTAAITDASGTGTITDDDSVPVVYPASNTLTSTVKGSIALAGAEIPAFDPLSDRAFASSGVGIQVVNLANPAAPVFISTITPSTLGVPAIVSNDISSVAVRKGSGSNPSVLAAAIINNPKTSAGHVVFLNAATGALIGHATVGIVPDHIAWTPDGSKLLVCNEGELPLPKVTIEVAVPDAAQGTVSIIAVDAAGLPGTVQTADFTAFNSQTAALKAAGVRFFDDGVPSTDFEPEYLAISPDGTKAMVTLQEANAVAVLDIASATFTSVAPLGKKNFSTLRADFSDADGMKNPRTGQPVFGLYMPDAIASFSAAGQTYYVTANEGDDRNDFISPTESTTVNSGTYDLDDTVFPNEADLKLNANLGKLTVSNLPGLRGDTDNDGDIDEILMYGARSFSIIDSTGTLVFDSGDMIEMIVASLHNSNFDDGRSDNKGPEPEGVTVATLGARTFAFVGLERSHMTLVFDVTNPLAPTYVTSLVRTGDANPEGIVVVSESDSPSGRPLVLVTNESSNTLSVFELTPATAFSLQLLHIADAEAGLLASQTAPNLAALVDAFDGTYANTLILAGGDNYIPGPFAAAGTDALVAATHTRGNNPFAADIEIHNRLGVEASTVGNHEFDFGTNAFNDAILDTNFPYLSSNLDFSGDSGISARYQETVGVGGLEEASSVKNKVVPSCVVTKGTQKIGLVGVTTQIIEAISSTGGVEVKGFVGDGSEMDNMVLLASQVQPVINDLKSQGVNKIILMAHLQQIANELILAPLLTDVDIILAAGSNTRLGDANDVAVAFTGHAANFAGNYPIYTAGADGRPTVVVNTDNEFTYLGRLVADFDADGLLIVPNLLANTTLNGAYAATAANVAAAWGVAEVNLPTTAFASGTKGALVKQITDAVQGVITTKDGDVRGFTSVYLEGERNFVRNQETNLGNISADSMITVGKTALPAATHVAAMKNGGGIRAAIGAVEVGSGAKLPPLANPAAGKPAGAISLLDIENSMRFNNGLMLCDTTPAGLKAILEHGVALLGNQGRFPQIGGIRFSYNPSGTAGSRIQSIVTIDDSGAITGRVVSGGAVLPTAPATITLVTLNFLAQGGDGYPFKANADNFRFLLTTGGLSAAIDESLSFTAAGVVPVNILGEQAALSSHLQARYATAPSAYNLAETTPALDTRIQSTAVRTDTVLSGPAAFLAWLLDNGFTGSPGVDSDNDGVSDTLEYFFNTSPNNPADRAHLPAVVREGGDLEFRFTRLQNGTLTGTLRYSTDLLTWQTAVQGVDFEIISQTVSSGEVEVRYRILNPINAKFFQLRVE